MDVLTVEEVAALLRVDGATVRRWIRIGKLPALQVGRQYRIERAAYEAFIAGKDRRLPDRNSSLVLAH